MKIECEIETKGELNVFNLTYVGVRLLTKSFNFQLTENAMLGNTPIQQRMDFARKLDEEGNARRDLIVFFLKNRQDIDKIEVGKIVELKP